MREWRRSWWRMAARAGWLMEGGEEILAPVVASNLTPHETFLHLIDPRELAPDFLDAIRKYRSEGTSCKINLALSGLPNFKALPGDNGPQHRATMHICPSIGVRRTRLG